MNNQEQQSIPKQNKVQLEISISQQNQQQHQYSLTSIQRNDTNTALTSSFINHPKIIHQFFKSKGVRSKNRVNTTNDQLVNIQENEIEGESHLISKSPIVRVNKTEIIEVDRQIPRRLFLDHLVSTPKQKLQSFKYQLKTMRRQNDSYLRNKMNVIKQKIKIKLNRVNQNNEGVKYLQVQNKNIQIDPCFESHHKRFIRKDNLSVDKESNKYARIQKYDPKFQQQVIRRGISIKRCHPLTMPIEVEQQIQQSSLKKDSFQKEIKLDVESVEDRLLLKRENRIPNYIMRGTKNYKSMFRNASVDWQVNQGNMKMLNVSRFNGMNGVLNVMKERGSQGNVGLPIIEEHSSRSRFNETVMNPESSGKRCNKSLDVAAMRKREKKLSKQAVTHNFIKGSLYYKLIKRDQSQGIKRGGQAQGIKKEVTASDEVIDGQIYGRQMMEKEREVVEGGNVDGDDELVKRRVVVVVSNKNITRYKQKFYRNMFENSSEQLGHQQIYKTILEQSDLCLASL